MGREFEIQREIDLPATPEQVWEAITTRRGLAGWLWDQEPVPPGLTPAAWDPLRRLRIELPAGPDGSTQAFEYVIEGLEGGRARLRFVHSGFLSQSWEGELDFEELTGHGWDMYLHTLAEYLAHFQDRTATYVTANGPPASAEDRAWPVLLASLGLGEGVSGGEPARVAVEELPAIEGVVDYVGPNLRGHADPRRPLSLPRPVRARVAHRRRPPHVRRGRERRPRTGRLALLARALGRLAARAAQANPFALKF